VSVWLYVSNLPEGVTEGQLGQLFASAGTVQAVTFLKHPETGAVLRKALVELAVHGDEDRLPRDFWDRFNGHEFGDPYLIVTPANLASGARPLRLTPEERALAQEIARTLGETAKNAKRQIVSIIHYCGEAFARRVLDEALAIEEAGGMLVSDGSRRRTKGGVYFYLVRGYVRGDVMRAIFYTCREPERRRAAQKAAEQQREESRETAPPQAEPQPVPEAESVKVPAPAPEVDLDAVRQQLEELRRVHQAAQAQLEAVKAGKAQGATGVLSLIKQVMDTSREIDRLIEQYPELR